MVADVKSGRCRDQAGKIQRTIFLSHKTLKLQSFQFYIGVGQKWVLKAFF